ncbi:MAG: Nramp family divalent metal transporter [Planctomycetota bacterium]
MSSHTSNDRGAATTRGRFGPGLLVTAAFIGPGTVVTASRAGAEFGDALLWGVLFSVVATASLQEMAARLGLVTRRGLAEAIRTTLRPAAARGPAVGLVLTAVVLGNAAYQTGNLIGAGAGVAMLTGLPADRAAGVLGALVTAGLALGVASQWARVALIVVVLSMSGAFLFAAAASSPDPAAVLRGVTTPSLPAGALLTLVALIGTTVVPYNLFLHATAVQQRWPEGVDVRQALRWARIDSTLAIGLGGVVTAAVVVTAAAALHGGDGAAPGLPAIGEQLRPALGRAGQAVFAAGLVAAGLTSAVTAPLAAGFAARGSLGGDSGDRIARRVTLAVAAAGAVLAFAFGKSPSQAIVVAQAANGLLLPLVAVFLLAVMNNGALLGEHRNRLAGNLLGAAVTLVAVGLGATQLLRAAGFI